MFKFKFEKKTKEQKEIALVDQNGEYSFPKGHLEGNEKIQECAIRETIE